MLMLDHEFTKEAGLFETEAPSSNTLVIVLLVQ